MLPPALATERHLILIEGSFAGLSKSEREDANELMSLMNKQDVVIMRVECRMIMLMSSVRTGALILHPDE